MEEMSGVEGTRVDRGSWGPLVQEGGGVLVCDVIHKVLD